MATKLERHSGKLVAAFLGVCLMVWGVYMAPQTQAAPPAGEPAVPLVALTDVGISSGADIVTSSLTFANPPTSAASRGPRLQRGSSALRITVALDGTDSTFLVRFTNASGASFNMALNSGTALTASGNCVYTFVVGVSDKVTSYNFRVGTTTRIAYLVVDQAMDGAP